jgi:hypothetical protein
MDLKIFAGNCTMGDKDYKDFKTPPKTTTYATRPMVAGAAHHAHCLSRTLSRSEKGMDGAAMPYRVIDPAN